MNFLSHFYFDQKSVDSHHIIGTILPDLLKNADKTINIHPEKLGGNQHPSVNSIIQGWKKHLAVDRYFHSSAYFAHHSHQLKLVLKPAIVGSPVKPFFLGHVALELILDNLLITTRQIDIEHFYAHLEAVDDFVLDEFLLLSHLTDRSVFFKFLNNFKKNRYLHSYSETAQIAYALKRICMRIWSDPFTQVQEQQMNAVLTEYRLLLKPDFLSIFNEIEKQLSDELTA